MVAQASRLVLGLQAKSLRTAIFLYPNNRTSTCSPLNSPSTPRGIITRPSLFTRGEMRPEGPRTGSAHKVIALAAQAHPDVILPAAGPGQVAGQGRGDGAAPGRPDLKAGELFQ